MPKKNKKQHVEEIITTATRRELLKYPRGHRTMPISNRHVYSPRRVRPHRGRKRRFGYAQWVGQGGLQTIDSPDFPGKRVK